MDSVEAISGAGRAAARTAVGAVSGIATLPLRIATAPVRLAVRAIEDMIAGGNGARPERTPAERPSFDRDRPRPREPSATPPVRPERAAAEAVRREEARDVPAPEPQAPRPPAIGEDHVDEGVELVGEFAEAGAEDGAGAEVRIEPPFEGYERMTVSDVRDRLAGATPELLAAVQLYEGMNRKRRGVLNEVEQRLALLDAPTRPRRKS